MYKVLFGDTYIRKHFDCALSLLNKMTSADICPIFTTTKELPPNVDCDCIVYFNKPLCEPGEEYKNKKRVLIDHGASNLKWFLASEPRFNFFDEIITAGPDHVRSIRSFFPDTASRPIVKSGAFIKAASLHEPSTYSRDEICELCNLDPNKPIILFAPTWHISANVSMQKAIEELTGVENIVTSLHPETAHLNTKNLNVTENINGITLELMKHCDLVISDTSSTLFEAAAMEKPAIQILLAEYSDNNSTVFDLPLVAGTCELFTAGLTAKPWELKGKIKDVLQGNYSRTGLRKIQKSITTGTLMAPTDVDFIIEELKFICQYSSEIKIDRTTYHKASIPRVMEKMKLASNRLIARCGGTYLDHIATNSKESIEASYRLLDTVQVTLTEDKDKKILVVNPGFEKQYGLKKKLNKISEEEFLKAKFESELTPISLVDLLKTIRQNKKYLILDIRKTSLSYLDFVTEIVKLAKELGVLNQLVFQAYSSSDFSDLNLLGVQHSILATWMHFYKDPLGEKSQEFIESCLRLNNDMIVGISVPFSNKHMKKDLLSEPRVLDFMAYKKRLYCHGAPLNLLSDLMKLNLGLFIDKIDYNIEIKDVSSELKWKDYLFLNKAMLFNGVDNQLDAIKHYCKYGKNENRLYRYSIPSDFNWAVYNNKNNDLKRLGVTSADSAKAHWTKQGEKEGRVYK